MTLLEEYYNKFNEEKRFDSRHGQVEFRVTMHFLTKYLDNIATNKNRSDIKVLDIGAGTGRYSIALAKEGYNVSAIELVKHNVSRLKQYASNNGVNVDARQGNALKLNKYEDESFDLTLLFGPMYHLFGDEDKIRALNEAKRVTKKNGLILVAYCMNEYALIMHGFNDHHALESMKNGIIDSDFKVCNREENLYEFVRISDIDRINKACSLDREGIFSPDGPSDYIRRTLNSMNDEEFEYFIKFQIHNAFRQDLIGAGSHVVDVLRK